MRSLRLMGTAFSAIATMAVHTASAQTAVVTCGAWSTTPAYATRDADCPYADATRVGAMWLFGLFGNHSLDARGARSAAGTVGVEYFTGGPSLDLFHTAVTGSAGQNAAEDDDAFTRLVSVAAATVFWEGLLVAGPELWYRLGTGDAFLTVPSFVGGEGAAHPASPLIQTPRSGPPDAGESYSHPDHQKARLASDVSTTPEPSTIALLATGLVGLGATRVRWRRRR